LAVLRSHSRRPPPPTLPPYTTLFRSLGQVLGDRPAGGQRQRPARMPPAARREPARQPGVRQQRVGARPGRAGVEQVESAGQVDQDRKSTRLNSSHVKTSYAVFCLKEK